MRLKEVSRSELFENLFEIDPGVVSSIQADMEINDYDLSQPLILAQWPGLRQPVLIDGYTRLRASLLAGVKDAPTVVKQFKTQQEALTYAVHLQIDRRNMSESTLLDLAARYALGGIRPGRKPQALHGGDDYKPTPYGRPIETLSQDLGISRDKAKKLKAVTVHCTKAELRRIKAGSLSISGAYANYLDRLKGEEQRERKWNARIQTLCRHLIKQLEKDFILTEESKASFNQAITAYQQTLVPKPIEVEPEPDLLEKI